jgi:hypothetical protein
MDGASTYGLKNNGMMLYKEADDNPLLNYFGCYILDRVHKVQNMQEYSLPPVCTSDQVDIDKYVSYSKTLEDETSIYRFSKELLAYLKTLVAFSPCYYADDPRSTGNIDKNYKSALELYKDIEYEQFHEYLEGSLKMWYENHPQHRPQRLKALPAEAVVEDVNDGDAPGLDGAPQKRLLFSMDLVITVPAGANTAAAVGKGAAQSSTTITPATTAAGSPRAGAGAIPRRCLLFLVVCI